MIQRELVGQIGSQIDSSLFLFDDCITNPDRVQAKEYERMIDTDETVEVSILFLTLSILMKLGAYQHENPKLTSFVNENFEAMEGNLHTACEEILTGLWAGYSGTEIVWRTEGERLLLDRLVTYHPDTVLVRVDKQTGRYMGIKQWRWFDGAPVEIAANKTILYTYRKRFGNHYGRSILKPVRKNWLLKDPILKMLARALDRFGTPFTSAIVPDEDIADPDKPSEQISQLQYAVRILNHLQSGTGIALRYGEEGQEPKITVHGNSGSGIGEAFEKSLQYFNKMIARGILVPSLLMDEGQSGSYSLGQSHFRIFNIMTSGIMCGLTETLLEQLVRPMIEYNFGKQKNYGSFQVENVNEEDYKLLAEVFEKLTNGNYLDAALQEDFDAVRARMGLPQRKVKAENEKLAEQVKGEYARYADRTSE